MHKHLRAWRIFRKLSQAKVGDAMHVSHSTIGRWEKGDMKLTTEDLEKLAIIYQCSVTQILAPPATAELVGRLDQAQDIIQAMDEETLQQWLALGRKLSAQK